MLAFSLRLSMPLYPSSQALILEPPRTGKSRTFYVHWSVILTLRDRFSQDMSVIDKELPFALIDLVVSVVQALMGAILMCLATGYFALTLPPVIAVMWGKSRLIRGMFAVASQPT